jgi:hypothetical protein
MKPALAILLLTATLPAFAESFGLPQKDELLTVGAAMVPLFESTPSPAIGENSAHAGLIRKGELVKVLDTKQYLSMFGTELWVQVARQGEPAMKGWAFSGTLNDIRQGRSKFVPAARAGQEPTEEISPLAPVEEK